MKPDITIIAPVYNVAEYLQKSIESVCKQTLKNIELILVDDGSTDASPMLLDKLAVKDQRIKVIHQINSGAAKARNNGIKHANGKYLYFLDPDDWLEKDMLQQMFEFAEKNELQLVITGFTNEYFEKNQYFSVPNTMPTQIYRTQKEFRYNAHKYLNNTFLAVPWNKLYLAEYIKKGNLIFPTIKWDDLHFNMEVIRNIESVGILNSSKYHFFRSRPGSETTKVFNDKLFMARKSQFEHILSVYHFWNLSDSQIMSEVYYYYELRMIQLTQEITDQKGLNLVRKRKLVSDVLNDDLTIRAFHNNGKRNRRLKLLLVPYKNRWVLMTICFGKNISFIKKHFSKGFYQIRMKVQTRKG